MRVSHSVFVTGHHTVECWYLSGTNETVFFYQGSDVGDVVFFNTFSEIYKTNFLNITNSLTVDAQRSRGRLGPPAGAPATRL
jgi:hypothetical protein